MSEESVSGFFGGLGLVLALQLIFGLRDVALCLAAGGGPVAAMGLAGNLPTRFQESVLCDLLIIAALLAWLLWLGSVR